MSTYCVTGGAGFIGSHLVERLLKDGHKVRVVDNLSTGKIENLPTLINVLPESILNKEMLLREAFDGCDAVFHLAALPSVPRSIADPLATHVANVTGTLNVLLAARDAGVRRVVFSSSSSVYGGRCTEDGRQPVGLAWLTKSPYAASKFAGEAYCRAFAHSFGLETVCLRYFNVFGPRQDPDSPYSAVIPRFVRAALRGEPVTIYGDGEQCRDFTYVDNVVHANLLAADAPLDGRGSVTVNVAGGETTTINGLVHQLAGLVGHGIQVLNHPARAGDVVHSQADLISALTLLGYEPQVGFLDGLGRTVAWYREREERRG